MDLTLPLLGVKPPQPLPNAQNSLPCYPTPDGAQVKLAAGWLIDRAGMKGYRTGHVGVHDRQALVLVNTGGATGREVLALARTVQAKVRECFGVEIDTEVNVV